MRGIALSFTGHERTATIAKLGSKTGHSQARSLASSYNKVMKAVRRTMRILLIPALMVSVVAVGFRAPMACATGPAATSQVEQSNPTKCRCGGQGKCCTKGCCAAEPTKPSEQKSQTNTSERRDSGITHEIDLVVAEFGPTAFPKPSSGTTGGVSWLGTLVAQHTCLQV